jgi:hypothetical protein
MCIDLSSIYPSLLPMSARLLACAAKNVRNPGHDDLHINKQLTQWHA